MSKVTHIVPPAGSLTEGEPDPTADNASSTSETSGTQTSDQISGPDPSGAQHAVIQYGERGLELKVIPATEGAPGVEISKLLTTLGVITLDPGFTNTGSTTSAITYIDGDAGILRYRGYPIEQLAQSSSFLETSYLLIHGELPTGPDLEAFTNRISRHTMLHEDLKRFFDGFPRDAHPMPVLSSAVSALSTFYQDSLDPFNPEQVELSTIRLLAKLPTIAAYAYKKSVGQPLLYPDNSLSLVENFLRMSFGFPAEPYEVNPKLAKALDQLLILHADHEQNCSTSTVRLAGSSNANLFASVSAGINALFGPSARRGEPSGAGDARVDPSRRWHRQRVCPKGEEQRARRQADGLWSSCLQELRPTCGAGQDNSPRGARRPRRRRRTA